MYNALKEWSTIIHMEEEMTREREEKGLRTYKLGRKDEGRESHKLRESDSSKLAGKGTGKG